MNRRRTPPRHKRSPPWASGRLSPREPAAVDIAPGPQRAPSLRTCTQEEGGHSDRRTASTPAMAAAAAKNIANRSASYAHAKPRLNKETNAIMVSSPTLASNPCLPSPSQKAPSGSAWVHEIKHDGYRLMARRDGNRVRLFTRRGYDWSAKYPWIVDSLLSLKVRSIIVDGEAVWCGKDGKSGFDRLHSNAHDEQVFLYADEDACLHG